MNPATLLPLVAVLTTQQPATPPAQQPSEPDPATLYQSEGYELVWAREFNTDGRPDPDTWSYEHGFVRNNEDQWYQEDNATIQDGNLIIEARKEEVPNPRYQEGSRDWKRSREKAHYTSSLLHTRGKHEWLYGRFEMRARITTDKGMWPAFWTLGSVRPWPGCGEIDIMEYYDGVVLANACWSSGKGQWGSSWDAVRKPLDELGPEGWSDEYHTWRMDWDADKVVISIDGTIINTISVEAAKNPDGTYPLREPHYILVNLAMGGNRGGDPSKATFPAAFEIDWIRIYQQR